MKHTGTDLKDGQSMTDSGYPRVMREWQRGTPLADSRVVHEGETSDVAVYMYIAKHRHHSYLVKGRAITFYTSVNSIFLPTVDSPGGVGGVEHKGEVETEGEWHELKVPLDSEISIWGDQLLVQLRSAWTVGGSSSSGVGVGVGQQKTYAQGSLLAVNIQDFVDNNAEGTVGCGALLF